SGCHEIFEEADKTNIRAQLYKGPREDRNCRAGNREASMTRQVRFAFIGTGGVAMLHAAAMRRVGDARLVGAWSPTPEHVTAFTTAQEIRAYRSLDELIGDRAIDAVAVLAAADSHFDLALK